MRLRPVHQMAVALALVSSCSQPLSSSAPPPDIGDRGVADAAPESSAAGPDASVEPGDALPSLSPLTIFGPKLSLWLDASEASTIEADGTGRLARWRDRSSNGGFATADYPSAGGRIDVTPAAINGHAALKFHGTSEATGVVGVHASYGVRDFALTMIVSYSNTTKAFIQSPYYDGSTSTGPWVIANPDGTTTIQGGFGPAGTTIFTGPKTGSAGWNDGSFHVITLRRDNSEGRMLLRVDGAEASGPLDADSWQLDGIGYIGGHPRRPSQSPPLTEAPLDGMIAEIIRAYDTPGTPAELDALARYVFAKYGLTL